MTDRRKYLIGFVVLFTMLLVVLGWKHIWWRTQRFAITENGRSVGDARIYTARGFAYVTLPEWQHEAYVVDLNDRIVYPALTNRVAEFRFILVSRDAPIDGVYWGKLERPDPQFAGRSVSFGSDAGSGITVRW